MRICREFLFLLLLLCSFLCCNFSFARIVEESDIKSRKFLGHFVFDTIPMNLEEITSSGEKIFAGTCIKIKEIKKDSLAKLPVIEYTFEVNEDIKGNIGRREASFKQWMPTTRDAGYEIGKKYVLFLYPESKIGLTSPVGYLQGRFSVGLEKNSNEEVIKNQLSNIGLSRNLSTQKRIRIKDSELNKYLSSASESGSQIRYKDFVRAVKYLVGKNEKE